MSNFSDELTSSMRNIMFTEWDTRSGQVVPTTESVKLTDGAVELEAVYLYADLARSTLLQKQFRATFAAKVVRMYLHGACTILRDHGGHIKSFDGDRVMAIFVGDNKRNQAVNAALKISWLVEESINPVIKERLKATGTGTPWSCSHGIGIDMGEALIVRAGVRNGSGGTTHNDLISIGRAPNVAAKLSAKRDPASGVWITSDVYAGLNPSQKTSSTGTSMWSSYKGQEVGPYNLDLYRSGWWRRP